MAGADYVTCKECGERIFYDGDRRIRDFMEERGSKEIVCYKCYKKLLKKIEKLKKFDRRRN